jgi:hypothetical protein
MIDYIPYRFTMILSTGEYGCFFSELAWAGAETIENYPIYIQLPIWGVLKKGDPPVTMGFNTHMVGQVTMLQHEVMVY